jgi:hypothetical protein
VSSRIRPNTDHLHRLGGADEASQSLRLGPGNITAKRRDRVVTASLVVQVRGWTVIRLRQEPLCVEPLQDSVEVPRHQPDPTIGLFSDVGHDPVPVTLSLSERHENQKIHRFQGKQALGAHRDVLSHLLLAL